MLTEKASSSKFTAVSSVFYTRELQLFVQMPLYKLRIAKAKAIASCKNKKKLYPVFRLCFSLAE